MPSLKDMLRAAQQPNALPLVVVPQHTRWLQMDEAERVYADEAIAFVAAVLRGDFKTERSRRISPSALGECPRRVLFGWAGAPQLPHNLDSQDLMDLGSWGHIRWQAEGITMGWITGHPPNHGAEVFLSDGENLGGTLDAVMYDDSIFELKTVGTFLYNRVVGVEREPKLTHRLQVHAYFKLRGREGQEASIVYEDRTTGHYHEFRIAENAQTHVMVDQLLDRFDQRIEDGTLPPMLGDCEMRQGPVYRDCPYRQWCPRQGDRLTVPGS